MSIPQGYYLKARSIMESDIMRQPPHVREVWDWLLMNANHKDKKIGGVVVKRGQVFTSLDQIREGLSWFVGYRKMSYTKDHMKKAMKALKKASMITTSVSTRGMFITISNYGYFQDPKNYESSAESSAESSIKAPSKLQTCSTINKNEKNEKNDKKEIKGKTGLPLNAPLPSWLPLDDWNNFIEMRKSIKANPTEKATMLLMVKLKKFHDEGFSISEILQKSTVENWKDVYKPKNEVNHAKPNNTKQQNTAHSDFASAAYEFATRQPKD